jgi:hypothetical protein
MVMNFSSVESLRTADPAGRTGFDIMLAVASARQAASPTARLSLRLAAQRSNGRDLRDMRRAMLAGLRTDAALMPMMAGSFAPVSTRAEAQI